MTLVVYVVSALDVFFAVEWTFFSASVVTLRQTGEGQRRNRVQG
jgi:hypothetical protein